MLVENIIVFIFENLFFVIIVLGGIFTALSNKKDSQEKTESNEDRGGVFFKEKQEYKPPVSSQEVKKQEPVKRSHRNEDDQRGIVLGRMEASPVSKTMQALAKHDHHESTMFSKDDFHREERIKLGRSQPSKAEKRHKKRIRKNLTKKGLINGIIMSEVLGPPRARKPYQNILM